MSGKQGFLKEIFFLLLLKAAIFVSRKTVTNCWQWSREKKVKLSLLVVTIIQKKDSKTKLPKDRPLPLKEGMNQKVPAKLCRNSSGTGRLNFPIFSVHRNLNNRGEGTRKKDGRQEKTVERPMLPNEHDSTKCLR